MAGEGGTAVIARTDQSEEELKQEALARFSDILDRLLPGSDLAMLRRHAPDYYEYMFHGTEKHIKDRIVPRVPGRQI